MSDSVPVIKVVSPSILTNRPTIWSLSSAVLGMSNVIEPDCRNLPLSAKFSIACVTAVRLVTTSEAVKPVEPTSTAIVFASPVEAE